jgi:hypothetical protein
MEDKDKNDASDGLNYIDKLIEQTKENLFKSAKKSMKSAKTTVVNYYMDDFYRCAAITSLRMSAINSALMAATMDPSINVKEEVDRILESIFVDWQSRANSISLMATKAGKPGLDSIADLFDFTDIQKEYDKVTLEAKKVAESRIRTSLSLTPTVDDLNTFFDMGDDENLEG